MDRLTKTTFCVLLMPVLAIITLLFFVTALAFVVALPIIVFIKPDTITFEEEEKEE